MKNLSPQLLHILLHKQNVRISILRIEESYAHHPLSHSIRALSDTLDELKVENAVYRLEFEQLFEIEGAFIIVAGQDEYPFYIVEALDRTTTSATMLAANGKQIKLSFDQLRAVWDGTVLIAEKGERTREESWLVYWIKQRLWFVELTAIYWIAGLIASLLVWTVLRSPSVADLSYLIKAAGIAVSLMVIAKASLSPHLAQLFCRLGNHSDCNEVFRSVGAKLFGWVSLGELSLTYFTASLLWGVFFAINPTGLFLWLNSLALLFVIYSLAWQIHYRKWCSLCLLIDGMLIADFLAELFLQGGFSQFSWFDLLIFSLLFALVLLIIRKAVGTAEENQIIPHLKFKRERLLSSPELFWQLLYIQSQEAADNNIAHATSNCEEADHTITVVINPSCPKCAKVHEELASLNDYRINLVFVVNEGDEHSHQAALMMISAGIEHEWDVADRIIRDWYAHKKLPAGFQPHPCAAEHLEQQKKYCQQIHLEGTPTVLVDNRRLPEIYDIEDLKVLL